MAYSSYKGWYQMLNPDKFIRPIDEHMGSYRAGAINYKSRLELNAFKYADFNKHVKNWSIEPFAIHYINQSSAIKKHLLRTQSTKPNGKRLRILHRKTRSGSLF